MKTLSYILLFGCAALLCTCSSKQITEQEKIARAIEQRPDYDRGPNDTLEYKAKIFDRFLKKALTAEEDVVLRKRCNNAPEANVFCFSFLNYDFFTKKTEARRPRSARKRFRRVYPKFSGSRIRNWKQLRFASVSSTISPVASISKKQLDILKIESLKEEACPNNIAVSVAAALEDSLPASNPSDIAELYIRGGDCLKNSGDRRTLITRGALFHLYAKEHKKGLEALKVAVSTNDPFISRPLFWKFRAEKELGLADEARSTFNELKTRYPFSFHTLALQMKENEDPGENALDKSVPPYIKRSQQAPTVNLLVEQVEILHHFGYDNSANTVLDWAISEADEAEPELKVYLAELRTGDGDHFTKISLLSNVLYDNPDLISRRTMELYFPKPFFPIFEEHSQGVDPYLLMAIARQESAFNPRAVSSARAQGLLQLLPKTARRMQKNSHKQLFDPKINVEVGSKYFQSLVTQLSGQVHLALAAYNAGPHKVSEWTRRYQVDDPLLFIDLVPYRETRDYVALILRNYYWYRRINATEKAQYPENVIIQREILTK